MSLSAPGPSPAPVRPPQAGPVLQSPQALATAATVLLAAGAVTNLFTAGISLYSWNLAKGFTGPPGPPDDPSTPAAVGNLAISESLGFAGSLDTGADFIRSLLYLGTAVVFLVWFHRVRCNGQVFRPDGFSQSAGWAIGGWFVPFANLFFPYRTARETWDASTQFAPDGSFRQVSGAPVIAWWVALVAGRVLDWVAWRKWWAAGTTEAVRAADVYNAVADLTTALAAVLAVVFVRRLTAMQHTKAVQGPNAAV